jgi:hypothetical protein
MPNRYYGKYSGIVKDNRDSQQLGQLQVVVPAIFDPNDVVLARPALPYGYFFVPEVGTKVWVEFEGGDVGMPLWTGVQYLAGEWPPEAQADPPEKRVIKSAAGHVLTFDDTGGSEKIEIKTSSSSGHTITLDTQGIAVHDGVSQNDIVLSGSGIAVQTAAGQKLELTSSGVTIQTATGEKVELTVAGITIDAGPAIVTVTGSLVRLGAGAVPVIRIGDSGIGNLGAPVVMAVTTNTQVLA